MFSERSKKSNDLEFEERMKNEWQPIESAPKNCVRRDGKSHFGPRILVTGCLFTDTTIASWWWWDGEWEHGAFLSDGNGNVGAPTHWMPIPEPPKP